MKNVLVIISISNHLINMGVKLQVAGVQSMVIAGIQQYFLQDMFSGFVTVLGIRAGRRSQ